MRRKYMGYVTMNQEKEPNPKKKKKAFVQFPSHTCSN